MACAGAAGLSGDRLEDFVVAVNELMTNAVRHGGGSGLVTVWRADCAVFCEVSDLGAGRTRPPATPSRPAAGTAGGWGLYLAGALTDTLRVETGAEGTTVRVSTRIA